jgi:hypothetical protein
MCPLWMGSVEETTRDLMVKCSPTRRSPRVQARHPISGADLLTTSGRTV